MRSLVRLLAAIGRPVIDLLAALGRLLLFALAGLGRALTPPFYPARFAAQVGQIGWLSLPVVGLTALFTGAALAQQIFVGGSRFNAESTVPAVTVIAIVRELGPVLAGLMVAGRVASAMAAEIGTMRVTEQIDALATLRMDPLRWLVAPRLVAGTLALPFLVIIANIIGVLGGWLLATTRLGFNSAQYLQTTRRYLDTDDLVSSLVKAAVFGFLIALMGCFHGFNCRGGAEGVGRATTDAVVASFIAILLANLVITVLVFGQ
jgi:phospholipid/cholesterol/gamma-HCH transport system permease protein